jgi:hypothetical protein
MQSEAWPTEANVGQAASGPRAAAHRERAKKALRGLAGDFVPGKKKARHWVPGLKSLGEDA